jgi:hypothetical protein
VGYDAATSIGEFCSITPRDDPRGHDRRPLSDRHPGATVMDGAVIGKGSIVGGGALVPRTGVPARLDHRRHSRQSDRHPRRLARAA